MSFAGSSETRTGSFKGKITKKKKQAIFDPVTAATVNSDVQHVEKAGVRNEPKKPAKSSFQKRK